MVFEIQLSGDRVVYMRGDENEYYSIVWVLSDKFIQIWHDSQKNDMCETQKRMPHTIKCFAQSNKYPVTLANGDICEFEIGKRTFKFSDGVTRTAFLIDNGAVKFPVMCSPCCAKELKHLAGE